MKTFSGAPSSLLCTSDAVCGSSHQQASAIAVNIPELLAATAVLRLKVPMHCAAPAVRSGGILRTRPAEKAMNCDFFVVVESSGTPETNSHPLLCIRPILTVA